MKILTTTQFAVFAAALASTQLAHAASIVVNAGAHSTIRASVSNQGASEILFVGDTTTSNDFLRSAVEFDLTNPLLTGATINSVSVTFTVRGTDNSSENAIMTLNLHELSSSFTNNGVTWTSRDGTNNWTTGGGDFGSVLASATGNPRTASINDTIVFSSASLASSAQSSIGGSLYLLAKSASENNTNRNLFQFASERNSINSAPEPFITIDYTPVPEPSVALLGGLGALLLLRRRR